MQQSQLLIVAADAPLKEHLAACFAAYNVLEAQCEESAAYMLRRYEPAVVLQDFRLLEGTLETGSPLQTLRGLISLAPHTKIVAIVEEGERGDAMRAIAHGACDYFELPVDCEPLRFL